MRILHTADVHLDRAYSGAGMTSSMAAARREELRDAFRRFVDLALELRVNAVTVGGDLYEHERSTLDTGHFLRQQFERLGAVPVLIAPGNHDPYLPDSLYRRVDWPANVTIFSEPRFRPVTLSRHPEPVEGRALEPAEPVEARPDTSHLTPNTSNLTPRASHLTPNTSHLTIWGAAHDRPDLRQNLLDGLRMPNEGAHVLLFHGSDTHAVPEGKQVHAGFRPEDIDRTGAAFALLGHYHGARIGPRFAYPGSPEALDFSEAGEHSVLLLDIDEQEVTPQLLPFGRVRYITHRLDVGGMTTSDELRAEVAMLGDREAIVRIVLGGQLQPDVELEVRALYNACAERFKYLDLVDRTEPAYDFESLAGESTTKGAFVRLLRSRIELLAGEERETAELALRLGLQAFERREVTIP